MDFSPIVVKKRNKIVGGKNYVYYEARSTVNFEDGSSLRTTGSGKTRKEARANLLEKI